MASGDTWTPEAEAHLVALALEGKTPQEIAHTLGRSPTAVVLRLTQTAEFRSSWAKAIKMIK